VIPVITTDVPSLLFKVNAEVPELYVPPVTVPVNPVIVIVPPVLLNKSNSVQTNKNVVLESIEICNELKIYSMN
jgi:hypothetical protein